ncbi:type II toxin-antitoxin system RelE/ParE family toxin [Candidatus Methylospira mobilis]|uniref:type II toxin-antitoxin system RelE/ParE family toxin n=1 Tax=Candidatus Methylospira mobilis TaxID=1808979 RepID=UPI0028F041F6|nr:type II toxin-antitoxin system RelE/ParE family toxin [Candidatus Methylospira mobilis]WNV05897.1 type II toxin-antitoxin system RelE/ParE family toxin [Candidatus Methylospira mobilis]
MPQVIYAPGAIRDLQRLREFLQPKNPVAAKRAVKTILKAVQVLGLHPQIGRPVEDIPEDYREWPIDFGGSVSPFFAKPAGTSQSPAGAKRLATTLPSAAPAIPARLEDGTSRSQMTRRCFAGLAGFLQNPARRYSFRGLLDPLASHCSLSRSDGAILFKQGCYRNDEIFG